MKIRFGVETCRFVFFESASGEIGRRFPNGLEEMVFNRVCPDGASVTYDVDEIQTIGISN